MKLKVIITGATGMVGEGVLHECLSHPGIEQILILTRKTTGVKHPKVKELIHSDFMNVTPVSDQLAGYDACFFCLGVTSIGKNEKDYTALTHTLTLHIAGVLSKVNKAMTFCYISGVDTDSSEKGRIMWARVKGRTENDLMKLPFKNVFLFRPGYMQPTPGLKHTHQYYKYTSWMYPFLRKVAPKYVSTLKELALAMINCAVIGYDKSIMEVNDIKLLATKSQ